MSIRTADTAYLDAMLTELSATDSDAAIVPGSPLHVRTLAECICKVMPDLGVDPRAMVVYNLARQEALDNGILQMVMVLAGALLGA